jgi:transposase
MPRKTMLISDDLVKVAETKLKSLKREVEEARRLQAIISAKKYSIVDVAKIYDVSTKTIERWIKRFVIDQEQHHIIKPGRGPKPKLSKEIEKKIHSIILNDSSITIDILRTKIKEDFGIIMGRSTVHRLMKKLRFSYITPRPKHYKSDPQKQEEFKKKSG